MKIAGTSLRPLELWRSDVTLEDAGEFGSALLASALRFGSGAAVGPRGPRPEVTLVLYEIETCPYSRLVREALSELDLDALIKPCPEGEAPHHAELELRYQQKKVPFLVDPTHGAALGDSQRILEHLYAQYGATRRVPLRMRGAVAMATSKWASQLRGGPIEYRRPARTPEITLELWNYEASPYCRRVREALARWGIPYLSRNLARNSPRRAEVRQRFGMLQFPRLWDPNLQVGLLESADIIAHIERSYATNAGVPTASRDRAA